MRLRRLLLLTALFPVLLYAQQSEKVSREIEDTFNGNKNTKPGYFSKKNKGSKGQESAHTRQKCVKRRAAFDIGSGETKLQVADIDTCKNEILKTLFMDYLKAEYKEDLKDREKFSLEMATQGIAVIKELKIKTQIYEPDEYSAVATESFRVSKNAKDLTDQIKAGPGIQIRIITQTEEARLGFMAASAKTKLNPKSMVVWDIGGGSAQMAALDDQGNLEVFKSKFASIAFKDLVITEVQKKPPQTLSPNPISESESHEALELAKSKAQFEIPDSFKTKLKNKAYQVIGIGGVHYFSVKGQTLAADSYDQNLLSLTIKKRVGLTDQQTGEKFPTTSVTNLILTLGYMQGLSIEKVMPLKSDMTDGILTDPAYWSN